jgi:chromosome segregation ATPase
MKSFTRIVAYVLVVLAVAPQSFAQGTSDEILRSLLAEVRTLRLTLQRSSLLSLRGDLLVERIRTAQSRVSGTQDQIDSVRRQITTMEQENQQFSTEIERLEDRIAREYDAGARDQLKPQLEQYRSYTATLALQTETARRNEAELLSRLDDARARLDGLEAAFDDLLKEIERALQTPE